MDLQRLLKSPLVQLGLIIVLIISVIIIGNTYNSKESMEELKAEEAEEAEVQEVQEVQAQEDREFANAAPPPEDRPGEISPSDLLPTDSRVAQFEQQFPQGMDEAKDKNFLIAGYHVGINTVASSLKNANLQLRSDPYIAKREDFPWNNSTIMPSDLTNRKPLEIGTTQ